MSFFDGLSVLSNWCRGEGVASRGCLCELEQVVGRADHRPFASDLIKTPEKELSETSGVFDLTEHRLDDLLAQSISAAAPSSFELSRHGGDARSGTPSALSGRVAAAVACPAWGEKAIDPAPRQMGKIGCQSAPDRDPAYCLICECYQGGGDATLS